MYSAQLYEQCSGLFNVRSLPWRRNPPTPTEGLEWIDRPWTNAIVLVCQECDGDEGMTPTAALKEAKSVARAVGPKGRSRVTGSGCLDVCPKRGIALTVSVDGAPARCAVVRSLPAVQLLTEALR